MVVVVVVAGVCCAVLVDHLVWCVVVPSRQERRRQQGLGRPSALPILWPNTYVGGGCVLCVVLLRCCVLLSCCVFVVLLRLLLRWFVGCCVRCCLVVCVFCCRRWFVACCVASVVVACCLLSHFGMIELVPQVCQRDSQSLRVELWIGSIDVIAVIAVLLIGSVVDIDCSVVDW